MSRIETVVIDGVIVNKGEEHLWRGEPATKKAPAKKKVAKKKVAKKKTTG